MLRLKFLKIFLLSGVIAGGEISRKVQLKNEDTLFKDINGLYLPNDQNQKLLTEFELGTGTVRVSTWIFREYKV